jgi:methanogenic corrinoid protein MtbC1
MKTPRSRDERVHDLGRDVKLEKFMEERLKTDSEIVGLSALMTTSMLAMPRVIGMIRDRNPDDERSLSR